jgi:hypothetical protein
MLEALEFAFGAVPTNEGILPIFTQFLLSHGRVQASNGRISIDSPVKDLKVTGCLPAERLIKALRAGGKKSHFSVTDGGKLSIKAGSFRALLPLTEAGNFPRAHPSEGSRHKIRKGFVALIKRMRPFVGDDATRPWVSNIVFDHDLILTTSNACIACFEAKGFTPFSVPIFAVDEILRIGEDPMAYSVDAQSITFFWEDSSWLKSQLIAGEWPIETVIKYLSTKTKPKPLPPDLSAAVEKLVPFCQDQKHPVIHFSDKGISTSPGDTQAEIEGFTLEPICFDARNIVPILSAANKAEIRTGDRPVGFFYGPDGFKAVVAGLKL